MEYGKNMVNIDFFRLYYWKVYVLYKYIHLYGGIPNAISDALACLTAAVPDHWFQVFFLPFSVLSAMVNAETIFPYASYSTQAGNQTQRVLKKTR